MPRVFISINPDSNTIRQIAEVQKMVKMEVEKINKKYLESIKWEPEDKFHMTVFFIGEIDEERILNVDKSISNMVNDLSLEKINFQSVGVNAFPKLRFPRVIILEFEDKDGVVMELSDKLNYNLNQLGFMSDKKFNPHITLGRVRRDHKLNLTGLKDKINTPINFSISKLLFMKSQLKSTGSEYTVIKEWEFRTRD